MGGLPDRRRARLRARAAAAVQRTLNTLRFFANSPQSPEPDATGYKGFYYHFLDMNSGARAWQCELSSIDTALLIAGMLTAAEYFSEDTPEEHEIRALADMLYRRVDWQWMRGRDNLICHGWNPESGFLRWHWEGYDEALILYVLALGSPTFPIERDSYDAWVGLTNGRRCTASTICTPGRCSSIRCRMSGWTCAASATISCARTTWTISRTAAALPMCSNATRSTTRSASPTTANCAGASPPATDPARPRARSTRQRKFYDYVGRGAPYGPDDGTLAPWAVAASLPFAPEIVLPTMDCLIH